MPFVPNFSSSQSAGDLNVATFTDTSTGFTGITTRIIYLRKYNGSYLVPTSVTTSFVDWPIVLGTGDIVNINVLDQDYCLDVSVLYYSGSSLVTSKTILTLFTGYGDLFLRKLTQALAANKNTITAPNFWVNKNKLRVLLDDAAQAVSLLNDQTIAQLCLDQSKTLTDNLSSFF